MVEHPTFDLPSPPEISNHAHPADHALTIPRRPVLEGRKESKKCFVHPYLSGNFAPVTTECPLTDCLFQGEIPPELAGCQYVRNGGNPMANSQLDRDAHWFDADGMLAGVLFRVLPDGTIQPSFLNRYILTDLLLSTPEHARYPYLPSIATLVNPRTSVFFVFLQILRSFILTILTWLPGLGLSSEQKAKRISVANTSIFWHDGKAMAGCESGPPMRIILPGLETAGWWTGQSDDHNSKQDSWGRGPAILGMLREFTTAHPHSDPITGELLLYHMCFEPPYLRVSVIPSDERPVLSGKRLVGVPVRGLSQAKMMHDFGTTLTRTIILDLPLSLDIVNLVKGRPILHYDPNKPSRFGIFPRYEPDKVRWFESPEACCVYHTANSWDEEDVAVNMLGCRLNSATLIYTAGNLLPPSHVLPRPNCPEKCQLYYWRFQLEQEQVADSKTRQKERNTISHEFALSDVPFEFPTINEQYALQEARYVYGTSLRDGTFDAGLGKAAKIDCLVKIDAETLIRRGRMLWSQGKLESGDSVDTRTVEQILAKQRNEAHEGEDNEAPDPIRIFEMPRGWYAQEATFVPRSHAAGEDDGWLVFYAFDEGTGLHPSTGEVLPGATSELWMVDAKEMKKVVCRIKLPQRVPYGLHGTLFTAEQIASQKAVPASEIRSWAASVKNHDPFVAHGTSLEKKDMYKAFVQDPLFIGSWYIKRSIEKLIA